jgi:hypothetical protein
MADADSARSWVAERWKGHSCRVVGTRAGEPGGVLVQRWPKAAPECVESGHHFTNTKFK